MSQSYPIWIDVSGDNYKQSKSFGSRDSVTLDIKVGSSKTYSWDLATLEDKTLGEGASKHWETMRKHLDWFRQYNAKAYMVLLD